MALHLQMRASLLQALTPGPGYTVFDFLSQQHIEVCHFISDIMGYFLAGDLTGHKPVSLTARLAINPSLLNSPLCQALVPLASVRACTLSSCMQWRRAGCRRPVLRGAQ